MNVISRGFYEQKRQAVSQLQSNFDFYSLLFVRVRVTLQLGQSIVYKSEDFVIAF